MADFVPHPLVTCVARELGEKKVPALKDDAKAKPAYDEGTGRPGGQAQMGGGRPLGRPPRRTLSLRRSPIRRPSPA